jgi:hypothetical protein
MGKFFEGRDPWGRRPASSAPTPHPAGTVSPRITRAWAPVDACQAHT